MVFAEATGTIAVLAAMPRTVAAIAALKIVLRFISFSLIRYALVRFLFLLEMSLNRRP
jgi:hypothetical protein